MSDSSGGQRFIRQVNDAIYRILVKLGGEDGQFWCECSDPYCEKRVLVTLREFAALGNAPLVSRSHALEMQES